ncbi:MAG: DNA mismatch repair endonuclease MutL [Gemmatimonadetes bacterium]|nr:DNA mismatch repair endonuclease MutL [Gemmatimonadota bacterium]NNM03624.1 DNA mismatch repair endonuclease MutL [Gemmatimonadota bacterium]
MSVLRAEAMTRRIHILPDSVANQIAAGEVVERPASVVKELVENALDAGARSVQVLLDGGGKQRIRVSDDGVGMGREDALLSLDRHATSKISKAGDLSLISTFGFRGEALPSIAAVSRLSLETSEGGDSVGTALRVEGGKILSVDAFPRQAGTTIEVLNLFFNAPARRKFLKTAAAETRAVNDVLTGLALANPSVGFTLTSKGRTLMDLRPVDDVATRISDLWGQDSASTLLAAAGEGAGVGVRGLIQRPDAAGPGFRRAHLFVNGRPFKSPSLLRAADRGYRTTTGAGQRPWLFLYLQVTDGGVDVNVHPAKLEVRFQEHAWVESLVEETVRGALSGAESSATLDSQLAPPALAVREPPPGSRAEEKPDVPGSVSQMALFLSREEGSPEEADGGGEGDERVEAPVGPSEAGRPRLWQIHDTYILAETREGLLIIDQHSAHERVLFQRLMSGFEKEGQESQRLLFPLTLRLSPPEMKQVVDLQGLLAKAGFEVEEFGGDTVILQSVPNPHRYFNAERCFREMVEELTEGSDLVRSAKNQHERIAMTFACKGAVKAGQRLSQEEMAELFDSLFATELPYHDVHGRPTIVRLGSGELERKFGRH